MLNYTSRLAILLAFETGTNFRVVGTAGYDGSVVSMAASNDAYPGRVTVKTDKGSSLVFWPHGARGITGYGGYLEVVPAAVAPKPPVAAPVPFLKRVLDGATFHCPVTRETLVDVTFSKGKLSVELKGEDGTFRESENYDHEGKHKWVPARSLVAGPVPPKAPVVPKVDTYTSEDLYTTAPRGTYENVSTFSGFRAKVMANGDERAVIFISGDDAYDLMSREAWKGDKFVKVPDVSLTAR